MTPVYSMDSDSSKMNSQLTDKDPSDMGFINFTKLIQAAKELDLSSLMLHKLEL